MCHPLLLGWLPNLKFGESQNPLDAHFGTGLADMGALSRGLSLMAERICV